MATEVALLPWLALRLPLPIPRPDYAGAPSAPFPWPFAGYRMLAGRTLAEARVSTAAREGLAAPLGRFLAATHAIPAAAARERGAGPDAYERLNVKLRRVPTAERLELIARRGIAVDRAAIEAVLDQAPDVAPRADVLVHGDLHAGQLLVDDDHALSGVIDWGDVHLGDPAVDLAAAHAILPVNAHAAFKRAYGDLDEAKWKVARSRAVWHTVALLASAADQDDEAMVAEAMNALERMLNP
jgi:aminoglycoside phosphotransferase (APT) family kinase protein